MLKIKKPSLKSEKSKALANAEIDISDLGHQSSGSELLALEPRVLLDAAGFVTALDGMDSVAAEETGSNIDAALKGKIAAPWEADKTLKEQALFSAVVEPVEQVKEIVFIDSNVEDLDALLSSLDEAFEVHILNVDTDGVEQIAPVEGSVVSAAYRATSDS